MFEKGQTVYIYNRFNGDLHKLIVLNIVDSDAIDCSTDIGINLLMNKNILSATPEGARELVIKEICTRSLAIKNEIHTLIEEDKSLQEELNRFLQLRTEVS